jgi:HPt (histidine-containing phosphotransfer) domain-containing protein
VLPLQVVDETLQKVKTDQLPQIKAALADSDTHAAHFATHSIKGASATIGFDSLSAAAKALDDLVRL